MVANIHIEQFLQQFTSKGPGLIVIELPGTSGLPARIVKGILTSDVNISVQTKFGPMVPGIEDLADLASMAGFGSIPTWVGASAQSWKGTDPITFGAEMYLINYAPDLGYEEDLKALAKTCTLQTKGAATIAYHRGYSPDVFASNKDYQDDAKKGASGLLRGISKALTSPINEKSGESEGSQRFNLLGEIFKGSVPSGIDVPGTITVRIGNRFTLSRLLLTKVDISPSNVEVCNSMYGEGKPLYYRVGMSFMTCRAALVEDVDGMFGG